MLIERAIPSGKASTPDPATARMAVVGSGVLPRKATLEKLIMLPAHPPTRRFPTQPDEGRDPALGEPHSDPITGLRRRALLREATPPAALVRAATSVVERAPCGARTDRSSRYAGPARCSTRRRWRSLQANAVVRAARLRATRSGAARSRRREAIAVPRRAERSSHRPRHTRCSVSSVAQEILAGAAADALPRMEHNAKRADRSQVADTRRGRASTTDDRCDLGRR